MTPDGAVELVRAAFADRARQDYAALAGRFAPGARWRAVQDGPWNCEGRDAIVAVMRQNTAGRPVDDAIAAIEEVGERLVVAFRPGPERELPDSRLDEGLVHIVVSVEGGQITELKACANREAARAYARRPRAPEPI